MSINTSPTFSIDHIDLTTNDLEKTRKFYKELFVDFLKWEIMYDAPDYFMVGKLPGIRIGFGPSNLEFQDENFSRYKIGLHHFAILVENREIVDQIYQTLLQMKATILDAPKEYPQYHQNYYAVFYQDPNGFKMEFVSYSYTHFTNH